MDKMNGRQMRPRGPKVSFERLLEAILREYGVRKEELTGRGRHRDWIEARKLLVYAAREWGKITPQELGRRLRAIRR